ncbi:hypothetical protein [Providencia hangzhouensis]|uniref:hypothetical protein n=1 Tax=Providencia hangzhouensis TaxID=3031799 RepID=UPI003F4BAFA4
MKKIGDVTNTADKNGEFTNGNISTGTPPTILEGPWLTAIQREILNVLVKAGVVQDPNKDNQLAMSIEKIAKSSVPTLVQNTGDSDNSIMSQKAVTDAISDSQVNVPDATTQVKGKVKLTDSLGESEELVLHQKAASDVLKGQNKSIDKINTLIPQSLVSTSNNKMVVEVIESNPVYGKGEINTYRKTKSGYYIRERIVTGGYSGGLSLPDNNCPVWRLGQLFIAPHILTLKNSIINKSPNVSVFNFIPDQFIKGDNKNSVLFHQIQGLAGEFIEFSTNTKEKDINILFAAATTTDANATVEIYVGDNLVSSETINTTGIGIGSTGFNTYITSIKNPRQGANLRVKIIKNSERWLYIAGINANFDIHISDDIDKVYWSIFNKTQLIRPTQTGAMCYVFTEIETGKFGGESHGGERPLSQKILVNNEQVTLSNSKVFSCESLQILQETVIEWDNSKKIECFTEHRFNSDGTHEFLGSFNPTANFVTNRSYCPMFTVDSNYFRRITSPEYVKLDNYPDKSDVNFSYPINKFEIQGKDGAYTSGIIWSSSLNNNGVSNLLIKPYADSSTKLYAGPSLNTVITLEAFSIHQLRYYF